MIVYDSSDMTFIFRWEGSVMPIALLYSVPSLAFAVGSHYIIENYSQELEFLIDTNHSMVWSALVMVVGLLLGVRTNKAYNRFWEGISLVQQMRAEWFEAASNLMAFSMVSCKEDPAMLDSVHQFQFVLVRLMSLMHGAALRQIGGNQEEFDVLDIQSLDPESMRYLAQCERYDLNRVEVLLHWIQVLVTDAASSGVIAVQAPILTRAYQTLSRGMVNLHNARKLADVPFPFPMSQMIIVFLMFVSLLIPFLVASVVNNPAYAALITFIPVFGMWGITFVANELEQPFGTDPNDLPLSVLQYDFNTTLLMLLDKECTRAPYLIREKVKGVKDLRKFLAAGERDPANSTSGPTLFVSRATRMTRASNDNLDKLGSIDHGATTTATESPNHSGSFLEHPTHSTSHRRKSQKIIAPSNHQSALLIRRAMLKRMSTAKMGTLEGIGSYTLEDDTLVTPLDLERQRLSQTDRMNRERRNSLAQMRNTHWSGIDTSDGANKHSLVWHTADKASASKSSSMSLPENDTKESKNFSGAPTEDAHVIPELSEAKDVGPELCPAWSPTPRLGDTSNCSPRESSNNEFWNDMMIDPSHGGALSIKSLARSRGNQGPGRPVSNWSKKQRHDWDLRPRFER